MRKPGGYTFLVDGDGKAHEGETFTCKHCQRITRVEARQRPEDLGGFCTLCAGLICSHCVGKGCDPFEAKLERLYAGKPSGL